MGEGNCFAHREPPSCFATAPPQEGLERKKLNGKKRATCLGSSFLPLEGKGSHPVREGRLEGGEGATRLPFPLPTPDFPLPKAPRVTSRPPTGLTVAAWLGAAFLHIPLLLIILYAFTSEDRTYTFPPPGLTLKWFGVAFARTDMWDALFLSVRVALFATLLALLLGSLAAAAMSRAAFRGKDAFSLLITLPIALPGIVTGIALLTSIKRAGLEPGVVTIILGHATFCIVTVYNNVVARLRRISPSQIEASSDLGARPVQTFRYVLLPHLATALLAGGLLSFALSFDEVIVTTFTAGSQQTLPIWMFGELFKPRDRPVTNVVAIVVMLVTLVPILLTQRLSQGDGDGNADMQGGGKSS